MALDSRVNGCPAHFEVQGTSSPMHGDFQCLLRSDPLDIQVSVRDYAPEIAAQLTDIPWITRLKGPGHAHFTLRRSLQDHEQDWLVEGGSFTFSGTALQVQSLPIVGRRWRIRWMFRPMCGPAPVRPTWAGRRR